MCTKNNINLPSAFTLQGTNHLPKIDNQGGIGSCASQSINRNQFTNAYSRFVHSADVNSKFDSKDDKYCFAPKYTYNFSGAGTIWVYETLMDHGVIPTCDFPFEKNESGGHIKVKDGEMSKLSAAWPVTVPGLMKKGLKNRLSGYERVWFTGDPYNEKLTTSEAGLELLNKIKAAVVDGNCVITGGYPSRWIYADIEETGTYGKKGEQAIVAAAGNAGGGHQVTIVGYDDHITSSFGGVTMKGAFIVANSYGEGWKNGGYTYLMYDACNTVSEFEPLNNPKLYSGQMYVTPGKELKMYSEFLALGANQKLVFKQNGTVDICGNEFGAYTICDKESGKYLGYNKEGADRKIVLKDEADETSVWSFIPYEKLDIIPSYNKDNYDKAYEGTYWVYAVNRDVPENHMKYLDAGTGFTASGRGIQFASFNEGKYSMAKSWTLECKPEGDFESRLGIAAGKDIENQRVWVVDQFGFTDWKKDIVIGYPELYIEVEIEAADRESFKVIMTRKNEAGETAYHMPSMFKNGKNHPTYLIKDKGTYLTFSANIDGEPETGYFALSYSELLKLPKATCSSDYKWGFIVDADKKSNVIVKKAALYYGGSETPLATINRAKKVNGKTVFEF